MGRYPGRLEAAAQARQEPHPREISWRTTARPPQPDAIVRRRQALQ
jgi:hypothetical protein